MTPPLIYLAHPVGGDIRGNCARARRWLRWLIDAVPEVHWVCPWLPYVDVLDDSVPAHREWAMQADLAVARRCDGIVLCGGRVSDGMRRELEAARLNLEATVIDLTPYAPDPALVRHHFERDRIVAYIRSTLGGVA